LFTCSKPAVAQLATCHPQLFVWLALHGSLFALVEHMGNKVIHFFSASVSLCRPCLRHMLWVGSSSSSKHQQQQHTSVVAAGINPAFAHNYMQYATASRISSI
jgi:hypothetical protein